MLKKLKVISLTFLFDLLTFLMPVSTTIKQSGIEQIESHVAQVKNALDDIKLKHIILDFSCVNYIDSQGVNAVLQV
jgi:hypothetical protein